MAQLTLSQYQTLATGAYNMKYIGDEIVEVDEYDFETNKPTGNKVQKLKVSLGVNGVEDEKSQNSVFIFSQLFTISVHERAALPKFLAAVRIPIPKDARELDTDPAFGRWVIAQVELYTKQSGAMGNKVIAWVADTSRKPSTVLTTVAPKEEAGDGPDF